MIKIQSRSLLVQLIKDFPLAGKCRTPSEVNEVSLHLRLGFV